MVFLAVRRRSAFALILLSTLAIGVAYLGMSVSRELWVACAFSVLGGLGNGVQWVSVMTALQEATPQDLQARVTGLLESVASAMTGVGFLLGGMITALTSPPTAFAVSGVGVLLVVGLLAVAWRGLSDTPQRAGEPRSAAASLARLHGARRRRLDSGSDLDDDRQHHRAPLQAVVDEGREVVVEHRLEHLDLGDALLGGAVQRVLDRLAQLVDEVRVAVEERHAAGEHLGRHDREPSGLARPSRR